MTINYGNTPNFLNNHFDYTRASFQQYLNLVIRSAFITILLNGLMLIMLENWKRNFIFLAFFTIIFSLVTLLIAYLNKRMFKNIFLVNLTYFFIPIMWIFFYAGSILLTKGLGFSWRWLLIVIGIYILLWSLSLLPKNIRRKINQLSKNKTFILLMTLIFGVFAIFGNSHYLVRIKGIDNPEILFGLVRLGVGLIWVGCMFLLNGSTNEKDVINYQDSEFDYDAQLNYMKAKLIIDNGNYFNKKKKYEKAIKEYEKAFLMEKLMYRGYINVARIFMKKNESEKGIPYLEKALQVDPNCAKCYTLLSLIYNDLKEYGVAIEYLKKAISLYDDEKEIKQKQELLQLMIKQKEIRENEKVIK